MNKKFRDMELQIEQHTLERARERGTDENEIRDVVDTGFEIEAKHGRLGKAKIYAYGKERNLKFYPQKRVEVIYMIEKERIITVTVYVFYGKW